MINRFKTYTAFNLAKSFYKNIYNLFNDFVDTIDSFVPLC